MKRSILFVMLLISIKAELCAQHNPSDKTFEVPADVIINRRFNIDLGKGNKMKLELTDWADFEQVKNIDSIVQEFLGDISGLKDSLTDPLSAKRIDHVTDAQGRKKIRFQQFYTKSTSYLLNNGDLASLRTVQDTIHLIGAIVNPAKAIDQVSLRNQRLYHLSFYLNDIDELKGLLNGVLKEKMRTIRTHLYDKWPLVLGTGDHYMKDDKSITAERSRGNTRGGEGDFIAFLFSVNVQNYKQYFVPSFSLGARLTIANRYRTFKWEPGLYWEPHFLFAKDDQNKLRTYRNDFLTLTYAQGGIKDYDSRKEFSFSAAFSLGYLIHREGEYFDKHTFRLGAGKIQLLKTSIEPALNFNNFFKGVTPCIRITQYF